MSKSKSKNLIRLLVFGILAALPVAACSDDDPGPSGAGASAGKGGGGSGGGGTGGVSGRGGTNGTGGTNGRGGTNGTGGTNGRGGTNGTGGTNGRGGTTGTAGTNGGPSDSGPDTGDADADADGPSDGGPDSDSADAGCPVGQVLRYETPGCNASPRCGPIDQDACLGYACSCRGTTITGCDYFREPYVLRVTCEAAGAPDG